MALVNGPLFSLDASGQLGKAVVYTKWKGRNVVREYVTPANPRSIGQRWQRGLMGVLSQWWRTLSETLQETWTDQAAAKQISTFNAMLSYDLLQAEDNIAPTADFGATPVAPAGALTNWTASSPSAGKISLAVTPTTALDATDLLLIGLSTISNADAQAYNHIVTGRVGGGAGEFTADIVGVDPGDYYLSAVLVDETGGADNWVNATGSPVTVA